MPDDPDSQTETPRRHRAIVWSLIVLASVLVIFSITANWVQRTLLDTDEVESMTDQILADEDVQEQLSIYTVDQLYATVDVQAAIEQRLPTPAQPLAAPVGAAVRQLATQVEEQALASPKVQGLVSSAVARAQSRLVSLIEDEGEYVSTTGGEVTLEYGSVVADLAARLGVDPDTISEVQGVVQGFSEDLQQGLTTAQADIKSLRSDLSQAQTGGLDSELQADLRALQQEAAQLQVTVQGLEDKIKGVEDKVPDQLQGALSELEQLLSDLDSRLSEFDQRTGSALKEPSQANIDALDAALASLESQINTLLGRQVVQHPGELVLMSSTELDGIQSLVSALRNLGFALPLLALLLYLTALFLAKGWRREAMIAVGGGILAATLLVLFARRLIGDEVTSLASSEAAEPAVSSVWSILSEGLRERGLFILVVGLAFVAGGWLAGPGRHATALRRFLAPYLRDHPVAVYSGLAILFLLWLSFVPGINNLGQILAIVVLGALAVIGVAVLRRQTEREFPERST